MERKNMIDVGAWVRVSSGGQDEANQLPDIERHCAEHGYRIVKSYELNDRSACKGEQRAKLDEMLGDMRLGVIKVLVCWHSDRLDRRGPEALLRLLRQTREADGVIQSVREPLLGTEGIAGETVTTIGAIIAHQYSVHLAEQVGIAHARIRANGGLTPGGVPWGYEVTGPKYAKTLVPADPCRKYVPQVFQRCIDGDSCRTIAEWLDSEGVPTAKGGLWNERSVWQMIKNMTYAGRRQDEGPKNTNGRPSRKNRRTVMTCEAVVTMDVWRQANEALRKRPARGPGVRSLTPEGRPLLANLKCARCDDSPMYRIKYYYRCFGKGTRRKGCGNMIRLDRLDEMVGSRMLAWNDEQHTIRTWIEGEDWDADIEQISQDIREIDPVEMVINPEVAARHAELVAQLREYTRKNEEEVIPGHWDKIDAGMTKGEYFYDLSPGGRREYLKTRDIRAEKMACCGGIRLVIDGREDVSHQESCADYPAEI
jgi:DNA invertase Pin-like site-specific DNA recombinase